MLKDFRAFLESGLHIPRPAPGGGTLLVTPLGKSPGAAHTAIAKTSPDQLVVVASADTSPRLNEVLEKAGVTDIRHEVIELADPYTGFDQVQEDLDGWLSARLVEASEVVTNVTGGTSVMQYAVERIAERARDLGTKTRTIALVDRRPYSEQQADPYVVGEVLELRQPRRGAEADPCDEW